MENNNGAITQSPKIWLYLISIGIAYMASRYDFQLSTLTLPQYQVSLGLSESFAQKITAFVKLGALPAILIVFFADKIGRKPVFIWSFIGFCLSAILVASAQNALMLLAGLFSTRLFTMVGELLAVVLLAEAVGADRRGYFLGLLALFGTAGDALALILYGIFGEVHEVWRSLYFLGASPIFMVIWWHFSLRESQAFIAAKSSHGAVINPLKEIRPYLKTLGVISIFLFLFWIPVSPALSLLSQYLQTHLGWKPSQITMLYMIAGLLGMLGNVYGGKLSDIFGRKIIIYISTIMVGIGLSILYLSDNKIIIGISYSIGLIGWFGFLTATRTLITESVNTEARATAISGTDIFSTLGSFIGNYAVGHMVMMNIKTDTAMIYLMPAMFIGLLLLLKINETKPNLNSTK